MTPNPSLLLAAVLAASALLAEPSLAGPQANRRRGTGTGSGAGAGTNGGSRGNGENYGGFIPQAQVLDRAAKEFRDVRAGIEHDFGEDPKKDSFLANVTRTEESFNKNAKAILTRPGYGNWEFDHLGKQVTVVITALKESASIEATYADDDPTKAQRFTAAAATARQRLTDINNATISSLSAQTADGKIAAGHTGLGGAGAHLAANVVGGITATEHESGQIGENVLHGERGPWWKDMTPEEALARSPVVRLGNECAKAAVEGKEPVITPPAPDPKPDPVVTNPPGSWGPSPAPPSTPLPKPVDIVTPIYSPGGRSQSYVDQGAGALQREEWARAAELARRALNLDPNNRSALAILHVSKDRVSASDSGGTGMQVAQGGASALYAGLAKPGAVGAGTSPETAALARSGAARLAGEQAQAGARNALKLGDAQGALDILNKALGQDPGNPALLHSRALAHGRMGRWEEALKDSSAGLALLPGNAALLGVQAMAQNRTRRWRDALASSEALIAADPRGAWGYAARAHAYGGLGNREAMLADINRAAAIDPAFSRAAAAAAELQLPSDSDVMFLFPGEAAKSAQPAAAAGAGRARSFSVVVGAGIAGGLLVALGLLSLVVGPVKDSVVSVFTRASRPGAAPSTGPVVTAQPVSAAGSLGGLIRGQYEISRQIGAGGMGMVYEGTDRSLGRRVAIKKMREELRQNPRERDRFIIEAKTVASLHHPSIVDIYAIAEEGDDVYLVFEYVDGKTVHDLVQTKGRLDFAETARVTRAMGDALAYAHAHGVIHRDMKPSNVMLTSSGQVKVMDFGIARMAKDAMTRYSMTNTVVGTPPYMAPEQEQGVVRKESDVYSLAICAYEMLTGKLPFIGIGAGMLMNKINMSYVPPSRAIAGLPESLDEVFLKAFQADPDQRHHTPQEFVAALDAAAAGARSAS